LKGSSRPEAYATTSLPSGIRIEEQAQKRLFPSNTVSEVATTWRVRAVKRLETERLAAIPSCASSEEQAQKRLFPFISLGLKQTVLRLYSTSFVKVVGI